MIAQRRTICSSGLHWPEEHRISRSASQASHEELISRSIECSGTAEGASFALYRGGVVPTVKTNSTPIGTNVTAAPLVGFQTAQTLTTVHEFNTQTSTYIAALSKEQRRLMDSNAAFLEKVRTSGKPLTATNLRNKSDWDPTKKLVIRDELMKIQMGGKTDLPINDAQCSELLNKIQGKNLAELSDSYINDIIAQIQKPNDQIYIDALKLFKKTGRIDDCFQINKLEQLRDYLNNVDLDKITANELKHIKNNYIEKLEIHHRTSISSDPTLQCDINNLDTLNTSQHDQKHTNPETGKIDYTRKLNEKPLDRFGELNEINEKRVVNKKIEGVGIAAAIGLGTGFAIGFIVNLAQNGLNPESLRYAFVEGVKQGSISAVVAAGSAAISMTVGATVGGTIGTQIIAHLGTNVAQKTAEKIYDMCNSGVVGILTITAFSIYEFTKLKLNNYGTKECLLRVGKSAGLSLSVLVVSIVANYYWPTVGGIVVSVVSGVVMTGYSVYSSKCEKETMRKITFYSIELCRPVIATA